MGPSIWQLLIIAVIVALIFGTKRLRNMGGDLGAAIRSFKKGLNDEEPNSTTPDDAKTQNDSINIISNKTVSKANGQTASQTNSSTGEAVQQKPENPQN